MKSIAGGSALALALLLAACATSPKDFYADPRKADGTALCRAWFDAKDPKFKSDVGVELSRRGFTAEECRKRVVAQNVGVGAVAVAALATTAVIACQNGGCGGGGYSRDKDCYGGSGDGPDWQYGPIYVGTYDPYNLDGDGDGWGCEVSDKAYGA